MEHQKKKMKGRIKDLRRLVSRKDDEDFKEFEAAVGNLDDDIHSLSGVNGVDKLKELMESLKTFIKTRATKKIELSDFQDTSNMLLLVVDDLVDGFETVVDETVDNVSDTKDSCFRAVKTLVAASLGKADLSKVAENVTEAVLKGAGTAETLSVFPLRALVMAISKAVKRFHLEKKSSVLYIILTAAAKAIEFALDQTTPLTSVAEEFKRQIDTLDETQKWVVEEQGTSDDTVSDADKKLRTKTLKDMADCVSESVNYMLEGKPDASVLHTFLFQALSWNNEVNKLLENLNKGDLLFTAVDELNKALARTRDVFYAKYEKIDLNFDEDQGLGLD